jgi:DNA-3-methyladenine glycosylase
MMENRLTCLFFERDVLVICPDLLCKYLVRKFDDGRIIRNKITEIEAYRGEEDLACHASKGRTTRTEVMYHKGGVVYVYLVYGMYWMLNLVTGPENQPQAILIRSVEGCTGPGRVSKLLKLDNSFYGENLEYSGRLWIEDNVVKVNFNTSKRIGIDYAGEVWKNKNWRFTVK